MTWGSSQFLLFLILLIAEILSNKAPFIPLNTVHQAHSQFQVNLILNENRNHPIILVTVSNTQSKSAAQQILQGTHNLQPYSAFSVLVQCKDFHWNLNHSLGICEDYYAKQQAQGRIDEEVGTDSYFSCKVFTPSQLKIKQKGHTIMKTHNQQSITQGKYFTKQYLNQVIIKNLPDFVSYIQDQYELVQFLQQNSDFKVSKLPKLLYFDQNLLAPLFLRKLSALLDGKIEVGVTDDPPLAKRYSAEFDSLILLQYSFSKKKYQHRNISFNQHSQPEKTIINDQLIQKYLKVKKNRDILLDFEHSNYTLYEFDSVLQIQYLQTHGRVIILQISQDSDKFSCNQLQKIAIKHSTLFNYVCFKKQKISQIDSSKNLHNNQFLILVNSIQQAKWVPFQNDVLDQLPKNSSRQKVSSSSQAEQCIKTANITQRYPIFFYFSQKTNSDNIVIMNYLNSLPEVTSLLFFCQIMVPDEEMISKFSLKINTLFTMLDRVGNGYMQKLQHTKISQFIQIKMFLRQLAIQKMFKVYQNRLVNNNIQKIDTNQQLTDKCFNRKCIVALIATGRYRQEQQINMIKQLKLQYQQLFKFVWIDGICHWDVPRQLKILKKGEKIIDRSYVFFYNEKDITYNLWEGKKHWDKKQLEKWLKSLKNTRKINHLKFGIDIQNRVCKNKKAKSAPAPQEL